VSIRYHHFDVASLRVFNKCGRWRTNIV